MRCPCRKKSESLTYAECCQPFHDGRALPSDAVALMRSRYCAFALENARYLLETWHPSTRPREIRFEPGREWRLLKIKNARADGDKAVVAFEARSRLDGRGHVMGETSRFVFQNGRWLYVDGDVRTGALGTS